MRIFDVTHDQIFNCVIMKISLWSMHPFLKILLFLCFHTSPITAIHTRPNLIDDFAFLNQPELREAFSDPSELSTSYPPTRST